MRPGRSGVTPAPFATGLSLPVDLALTPGGELAYVAFAEGAVRVIRWSPDNATPTALAAASAHYGPTPLAVEFSAAGSADPDGHGLDLVWDFGDGGTASGSTVEHTYTYPGLFLARLTVTDSLGASATADLVIGSGNAPPVLTVRAP